MFATERRSHSRTGVYADLCARFPVDTCIRADRLGRSEKCFKTKRFDVFQTALDAFRSRSVWQDELAPSRSDDACSREGFPGRSTWRGSRYPVDSSQERVRERGGTARWSDSVHCGPRLRRDRFLFERSGAAHPLQIPGQAAPVRGGRQGSQPIQDREVCSAAQRIAELVRYEEMTR